MGFGDVKVRWVRSLAQLMNEKSTDAGSLAMGRMEQLFDQSSLQLLRTRVKSRALGGGAHEGDGVLIGIGTVNGRPVACYSQDARVAGGSLGEAQADAIVRLLSIARDAGMPVVSFLESSGARIQEGVTALAGYARVFNEIVALSRVVPQISVVAGTCAGGSAYAPALTDFVIMTEPSAMFLTGPRIVRDICSEEISIAELGGSRIHRANGVCQLIAHNELEAAAQARRLLSFCRANPNEAPHRRSAPRRQRATLASSCHRDRARSTTCVTSSSRLPIAKTSSSSTRSGHEIW